MIDLDSHESSFLSICRHYRAIYDSKTVQNNEDEKKRILKHVVLFIILAPYDNEQSDLLHRIKEDKTLEDIPQYRWVKEPLSTLLGILTFLVVVQLSTSTN